MAKTVSLTIGGRKVKLERSETLIAVQPRVGMSRSMDGQLRSMARRMPVESRGSLEGFEIVEVEASPEDLSKERTALREAASVGRETPVYHTSGDRVPFVPIGTIYLCFERDTPDDVKEALLRSYELELLAPEPDGFLTVRLSSSRADAVEVAARLQKEAVIATAEPDLATSRRLDGLPNDALLERQWHLQNTGTHGGQSIGYKQGADARVIAGWKRLGHLGSEDVVVGVIDDGFDLDHPDLAGKAVRPWDFKRGSSDVSPEPDPTSPVRGDWHGTSCAGVALGRADGGQIVGTAPNARLMPLRMKDSLSPDHVAKWFDYLRENGAWVASCSWGAEAKVYPLPDRIAHAISRCAREGRDGNGCVVVFAAGNSNRDIDDPPNSENGFATHPDVLAVSACTSMDERSDYSNFGKAIAVCAPSGGRGAWSITTADVHGTYFDADGVERSSGYGEGDYNYFFSGTSSACPLVAGVCALILSANPDLDSAQVRGLVKETARKIGNADAYANGHSVHFGYGCVDADRAIEGALRLGPARSGSRGRDGARAALPNLFEFTIAGALRRENATAADVAAALASSKEFLRAIQLGLDDPRASQGIGTVEKIVRAKLAKAFSASTAGFMFDRDQG